MGFILGLVLLFLLGGAISLIVLLPPLRRLGRNTPKARMIEITVLGLLSFSIAFLVYSWVGAEIVYIFGMMTGPSYDQVSPSCEPLAVDGKVKVVQELWVRSIVPPPMQSSCYTNQVEVCEFADRIAGPKHGHRDWSDYLISVGWCLIQAFVSGVSTWFFTRKPRARVCVDNRLFQTEG